MSVTSVNRMEYLTEEERFIEEGLREGRCRLERLSMKALTVDWDLQIRVKKNDAGERVDDGQVQFLEGLITGGDRVPPIVVFREPKTEILRIGTGFHRWKAHFHAKIPSILAYVFWGGFSDALSFSVICNRKNCLQLTDDDIRRAAELLFSDETWKGRSDDWIADHLGVGSTALRRWRLAWLSNMGLPSPDMVETRSGKQRPWTTGVNKPIDERSFKDKKYKDGKRATLSTPAGRLEVRPDLKCEAEQKIKDVLARSRSRLRDNSSLDYIFNSRGFFFRRIQETHTPGGAHGHGFAYSTARFDEKQSPFDAAMRALAIKHLANDASLRPCVLHVREDVVGTKWPKDIILLQAMGISFLSVGEFLEILEKERITSAASRS